ncbi:MAG: tetratricopeptide repeat protein [Promethearchaeota archaeon]|nr:MAG: tetratricopeptide repeat protein [Candidatus Lokiarchaeota archaeon]
MVAIMGNEADLTKSKELFKSGDIEGTLETYEKALSKIDKSSDSRKYILFLKDILDYCKENNLQEEEATALRAMGRTYSVFKQYVDSLKYHWLSLKIQRKLGKKKEVAEGLIFIAEDLEVRGDYDESRESYNEAIKIYEELGKKEKVQAIKQKLKRIDNFSKETLEEDYLRSKFNIGDF